MGWRDEAEVVTEQAVTAEPAAGSWRDQAEPVEEPGMLDTALSYLPQADDGLDASVATGNRPVDVGMGAGSLAGIAQAASLGTADEIASLFGQDDLASTLKSAPTQSPGSYYSTYVLTSLLGPGALLKATKGAGALAKTAAALYANPISSSGIEAAADAKEGERLEQAGKGLLTGTAAKFGLEGIARGAKKILQKFTKNSDELVKATKSLGMDLSSDQAKELVRADRLQMKKFLTLGRQEALEKTGKKLQGFVEEYKDFQVPATGMLQEAYDSLKKFVPGKLDDKGAKEAFETSLKEIDDLMRPNKAAAKARFEDVYKARQRLGEMIYDQESFGVKGYARKKAIELYRKMNNELASVSADKNFKNLNKTYSTVTSMNTNKFTGGLIQGLARESSDAPFQKWKDFSKNFADLPEATRKELAPFLNKVIEEDIPNTIILTRLQQQMAKKPTSVLESLSSMGRSIGLDSLNEAGRMKQITGLQRFTDNPQKLLNPLGRLGGQAGTEILNNRTTEEQLYRNPR